jgi:tetratricopeptide (TPR) repeat protein
MYLRARLIWVISVFCVLSPYVFAMEWYESYDRGKNAVEKGKCADGVPLLQDAVKKQPNDDLQARPYGAFIIEYIPHYYLAKCAVESGDLKAAQQYIRDGDAHGVASSKKAGDYAAVKRSLQEKLAQGSNTTVNPPANQNTTNTNPPGNTTTGPTPAELEAQRKLQEEARRQAQIKNGINDARAALNSNRFEEARAAARQVLNIDPGNTTAAGILIDIDKRMADQQQAQQQAQQAVAAKQDKLTRVRQAINGGDLISAENLAMDLKRDYPADRDVGRLLDEIRKRKNDQLASQQLDGMKVTEKQVMIAYFNGQYQTVVDLVNQNQTKYQKSWRLPFYQGCALASLSLLDANGKEAKQNQAKELFRKAKQIAGQIPENPYISPKIWELFRSS